MSPSTEGPTLGDRLGAARARSGSERTPPASAPTPAGPSTTTRALGASLGLLATFVAAIAFAFVSSRLVGGMYITFAMPVFVGTLIAALAALGPKRFEFGERRPLVMMMIAGALICWLGQHLLAYLRVIDIVAAQQLGGAETAEAALAAIERATEQTGFLAYLSYVSQGDAVVLSPIGLLGRIGPGTVGTVLIALAELGLMAAAASWSILYRTRHLSRAPTGPLALFDDEAAANASDALRGRRFDALASIIADSRGAATHALTITEGESTAEVALRDVGPNGELGPATHTRLMSIEAARTLRIALAEALAERAARDGGPDATRDA